MAEVGSDRGDLAFAQLLSLLHGSFGFLTTVNSDNHQVTPLHGQQQTFISCSVHSFCMIYCKSIICRDNISVFLFSEGGSHASKTWESPVANVQTWKFARSIGFCFTDVPF